jgi:hypothetical protein
MEMAFELNIAVPLKPERTAEEWAKLRQQVADAWKRERDVTPPTERK